MVAINCQQNRQTISTVNIKPDDIMWLNLIGNSFLLEALSSEGSSSVLRAWKYYGLK